MTLATIARLRLVAERMVRGELPADDGRWLGGLLQDYLTRAPEENLTLDHAFGLAVEPGGEPWWSREWRALRDELVREYFAKFCGAATFAQALARLQSDIRRYERAQWPRDGKLSEMPVAYEGLPRGLLLKIFRLNENLGAGAMPSSRNQLTRILATHYVEREKVVHGISSIHGKEKGRSVG